MLAKGDLLIRVKPKDLAAAGVDRVPRTTGVEERLPRLEDGRRLDVANVVWCSGFHPGFSWIDLPVLGPDEPNHDRGVVDAEPGLHFVGLRFLYSKSSEQIHGVGRDAARIADVVAARHKQRVAVADEPGSSGLALAVAPEERQHRRDPTMAKPLATLLQLLE